MNLYCRVVLVLFTFVCTAANAQLPRVELSIGLHRISAEVAFQGATRQKGLMWRKQMAPYEGMIFVFRESDRVCMWMRNTYIPLSVAFIDDLGRILNIEDMTPQSEDHHCAVKPVRYALEMNRGWFAERGLAAGSKLSGLQKLPEAR